MHQRTFYAVIILAAFFLLTGMGGSGGFERAPRVEKSFAVVVTDVTGRRIEGAKFSWEGRIHFAGSMGMAQVNVPFDRITELAMGEQRERKVRVVARLIDGTESTFDADAKTRCFGESSFGSFMLQMDEIRSIVFKH